MADPLYGNGIAHLLGQLATSPGRFDKTFGQIAQSPGRFDKSFGEILGGIPHFSDVVDTTVDTISGAVGPAVADFSAGAQGLPPGPTVQPQARQQASAVAGLGSLKD